MNIPEEFGSYLLLKKLSEDALGETFRAAKVGARGLEQVSLLRVLNGKGIDGGKLWPKLSNGAAIQAALRSPNIGNGVDVGRVRNQPYVAYDYISGKNLATIFAQTERRMSPIPTDHALLIAERLALALAVASESRVGDQRVLHGFVVPHLAMVSNEGETRLLGFEIASGLREVGGIADPDIASYLAPEAAAGAPVAKADDCWSLGAILFELLTGERLRQNPPEGHASRVDQAVLAHDGSPIPAPVADLLKKSLQPRDQRIGDAGAWHKAITKLMSEGHFSPTTFNLAFFMHNLFRDDIERENQELQAEKKLDLRAPAPSAVVAAPVVPAAAGAAAVAATPRPAGAALPPPTQPTASSSKTNPMIFVAAAVVLLGLVGGGAWMMMRGKTAAPVAAPPVAAPVEAAPTPEPAQPAMTQEQIQEQIDQLVQAQIQASESKLKSQYDDRLKLLQKQLEENRRPAAPAASESGSSGASAPEPRQAAATPRPVETPPAPAASAPAPAPAQTQPAAAEPA